MQEFSKNYLTNKHYCDIIYTERKYGGLVMNEKQKVYDELSRVLTDYENGIAGVTDLYIMLCEIQRRWEDTITANED